MCPPGMSCRGLGAGLVLQPRRNPQKLDLNLLAFGRCEVLNIIPTRPYTLIYSPTTRNGRFIVVLVLSAFKHDEQYPKPREL